MRKRIVIGHPFIGRGGSEAALMWLIEALKDGFEVTVASTGGWNLAELNAYYGTHVREEQVTVRIAPVPWAAQGLVAAALRGSCFQSFARQIAAEYDIRISAYNLTDWGLPATHFIADFSWRRENQQQPDPIAPGLIYRDSWLRRAYLGLATGYANPSRRNLLTEDNIIANSRWSADLIRKEFGIECAAVIYPPVWTEFPRLSWESKENAFAMIGRIAPEKRIEEAIAILNAVRQRGHAIGFHLCGRIGSDAYGHKIAALCKKHADWIVCEGPISGSRKGEMLARCRYGIQTRSAEPFGIAVAEMIKAEAIVFARNEGGPVEILENRGLLFADAADAADKVCGVLESPARQAAIREQLAGRPQLFAADAFMGHAREYVETISKAYV